MQRRARQSRRRAVGASVSGSCHGCVALWARAHVLAPEVWPAPPAVPRTRRQPASPKYTNVCIPWHSRVEETEEYTVTEKERENKQTAQTQTAQSRIAFGASALLHERTAPGHVWVFADPPLAGTWRGLVVMHGVGVTERKCQSNWLRPQLVLRRFRHGARGCPLGRHHRGTSSQTRLRPQQFPPGAGARRKTAQRPTPWVGAAGGRAYTLSALFTRNRTPHS